MIPRIAIPIPTTLDADYTRRCLPPYLAALTDSAAEPVLVPLDLDPADQQALADSCHGVLLPGSLADVNPLRYGHPREPACAPDDPAREAADLLLLRDAELRGKPVLGICYGLQIINVWKGGSLLQDLLPQPVNHPAGPAVAKAHPVAIQPGTVLASLAGAGETSPPAPPPHLMVNSSHHQAVGTVGHGLRIVARSPADGVIEALESDPARSAEAAPLLLAVQWHPERSFESCAISRALFGRLADEARSLL